MTSQMMPSRIIAPMPVSQWAALCVHRASGFWPLGPWLIDDWMTFQVDRRRHRAQAPARRAIAAMSPSVPVTGQAAGQRDWTGDAHEDRHGLVALGDQVRCQADHHDVTDSTASATKISISAGPGITTRLTGLRRPGRPA